MDTNNSAPLSAWVEERLASLAPRDSWEPNSAAALARLKQLRASRSWLGSRWPWAVATAAVVCLAWVGRALLLDSPALPAAVDDSEEPPRRFTFLSSHLATLVTLSTPAIGLWLLTSGFSASRIFSFRLEITLLTIFLLTLLLSTREPPRTGSFLNNDRGLRPRSR